MFEFDFLSFVDNNMPHVVRDQMNTIKPLQQDSAKQFKWCLQNKTV